METSWIHNQMKALTSLKPDSKAMITNQNDSNNDEALYIQYTYSRAVSSGVKGRILLGIYKGLRAGSECKWTFVVKGPKLTIERLVGAATKRAGAEASIITVARTIAIEQEWFMVLESMFIQKSMFSQESMFSCKNNRLSRITSC